MTGFIFNHIKNASQYFTLLFGINGNLNFKPFFHQSSLSLTLLGTDAQWIWLVDQPSIPYVDKMRWNGALFKSKLIFKYLSTVNDFTLPCVSQHYVYVSIHLVANTPYCPCNKLCFWYTYDLTSTVHTHINSIIVNILIVWKIGTRIWTTTKKTLSFYSI